MSLVQQRLGAQSLDGINARVGFRFLDANRTLLMLPLSGDDCPTDPSEMLVKRTATYKMSTMFEELKPSVEVALETGKPLEPIQDEVITFKSIKNFEPDDLMQNIGLLKALKNKQSLISRLEMLMQESAFQKIMQDKTKKAALVNFLRSVVADIDAANPAD